MHASIHRAGLAIATLAVVTVVGGYFVVDGYLGARSQAAAGPVSASVVAPAPVAAAETAPPQVVYVRPAPPPAVIHVTQTAPPARQRIVHLTVPSTGGENESDGGTDSQGGDG
jgi:hypothetical protein